MDNLDIPELEPTYQEDSEHQRRGSFFPMAAQGETGSQLSSADKFALNLCAPQPFFRGDELHASESH